MGYQFTNNYPYSASVFPSMIDHVDPVNQEYFTGLHNEILALELCLGLLPWGTFDSVAARLDSLDSILGVNPAEDFADIKDKLENHGHTGGTDGRLLWFSPPPPIVSPPYFSDLTQFGPFGDGYGPNCGFAYSDCIYVVGFMPGEGEGKIGAFNTYNKNIYYSPAPDLVLLGGAAVVYNGYAWITEAFGVKSVTRYNPNTASTVITTITDSGSALLGIVQAGGFLWSTFNVMSGKLLKFNPDTYAYSLKQASGSMSGCSLPCTDGENIYFFGKDTPYYLVRYNIAGDSFTLIPMPNNDDEYLFLAYYDGYIFMFSNGERPVYLRYSIALGVFVEFTASWAQHVDGLSHVDDLLLITSHQDTSYSLVAFDPSALQAYYYALGGSLGTHWGCDSLNGYTMIGGITMTHVATIIRFILP